MKQSVVDIPKVISHNKYNFDQLTKLPTGKALRTELNTKTEVRTARGVAWNYCKHHNLKCSSHTVRNNGHHILYTWLV